MVTFHNRAALQETPMETPQANAKTQPQQNRIPKVLLIALVIIAVCSVATRLLVNRANASRPQLEVRNIGSKPVLLRHEGNDLVVRPGGVAALRFSPSDTLTIFPGETETSIAKSVQLAKRGTPQGTPSTPSRVAAEVNADDEKNIVFQYADSR